jgi:hypothetical protein
VSPTVRALALAVVIAAPTTARAACEADAALSVGVAVRRCTDPGIAYSVVTADLAASDVGIRVSRSAERGGTVDGWMTAVPSVVAAVQGGPFSFPEYEPLGLTVGESEAWPGTEDDGALAVLALDSGGAGFVAPPAALVAPAPWMASAISGRTVLRAGVPIVACRGSECEPMPRTAVGLSEDGHLLVIVVVEGWTASSRGVSDAELGALARSAGAYEAIRVGEGATSVLATRGGAGAVASSDGAPRATAAFLGVVDRGSGATGDLVGVVQRRSDTTALVMATITIDTTDGRRVAMGGTLTAGAFWSFPLPERTYVVRASHAGYRTNCRVCTVTAGRETWCSLFLEAGTGSEECMAPPRGVDAGALPIADAGDDVPPTRDGGRGGRLQNTSCSTSRAGASPMLALALAAGIALSGRRRAPRRAGSRGAGSASRTERRDAEEGR